MFNSTMKRCAAAASLVAGLLGSASVQAVVYVGSWDPTFNLADARFGASASTGIVLGWRGHFLGDVAAGCDPGAGSGLVVVGTGAGCAASLSSAVVDLYAATDPAKATIANIDFDLSIAGNLKVLDLLYDNGVLKQLRTTPSGMDLATYVPPGSVYETIAGLAVRWQLLLDFADPSASIVGAAAYDGPRLSYAIADCVPGAANQQPCSGANAADFAPVLHVAPAAVPEPAGAALALTALAALAMTRRRPAQTLSARG